MAILVKKLNLWRCERPNRAGSLAEVLEPLAGAGCDLHVVMGYRLPEFRDQAAIEVFPIKGKKAEAAARQAGLHPVELPCLLVTGANRAGLGHTMATRLAGAGININFIVTQVMGKQFTSVMGFDSKADADAAVGFVKAAAKMPKVAAKKKVKARRR
jgi:predicted amino acid-binding ACT domain protein